MAVQIFQELGKRQLGVLTDCQTENDFVRELSICASKAIISAGDVGNPAAESRTEDQQINAMAEGAAPITAEVIRRAVEIILKYRGYKSEAKERRELYSGDLFPPIGSHDAAFSTATDAKVVEGEQ